MSVIGQRRAAERAARIEQFADAIADSWGLSSRDAMQAACERVGVSSIVGDRYMLAIRRQVGAQAQ